MNAERITITAGIGFDRDGNALPAETLAESLAVIRGTLAHLFGGYSEVDTFGGWINGNGELVTEAGKRWLMIDMDDRIDAGMEDAGTVAARAIREALRQETVVLEREPVYAGFVGNAETV